MKRGVALLLTAAVVGGLSPAADARTKRPKPSRDVTFYLVPDGDGCMLSTDPKLADPSQNCSGFPGAVTPATPGEPVELAAADGLPLKLDAARPVRGVVTVWSTHLVGDFGPLGIGEAQVVARLSGTADGKDVLVGETTTDPYTVTPMSGYYSVEFEITPDAAAAGVLFEELTLSLHTIGTTVSHGGFQPDGQSTLTLRAVGAR